MPVLSDWMSYNGARIRMAWAIEGISVALTAEVELPYTRSFFGWGPWVNQLHADAKYVGCYIYAPVTAGDAAGPRVFVTSLGVRAALPDRPPLDSAAPAQLSFTGSFTMPAKGFIVVFHLLNASGQVLGTSVACNRVLTPTSSGNDVSDYAVAVGNTVLDATAAAGTRAVESIVDAISKASGIDKQTTTILLIGVTAIVVIAVLRK